MNKIINIYCNIFIEMKKKIHKIILMIHTYFHQYTKEFVEDKFSH
jgi:hypothetical protein